MVGRRWSGCRPDRFGLAAHGCRDPPGQEAPEMAAINPLLRRASAHRGGMPLQRKARHLGEPIAVEPQDVDVALDKIPHVEETPIWAEGDPLGEPADWYLRDLANALASDFQQRDQ